MLDYTYYDQTLNAHANPRFAQKRGRQLQTIRGVRGVENAVLIELINESLPVVLEQHDATLNQLFGTAFEDGLIAISLLAVAGLENPSDALVLARHWLTFVDDVETADALGRVVIGPCLWHQEMPGDAQWLAENHRELLREVVRSPFAVRAMMMASLAWLPEPVPGVTGAGLRAAIEASKVAFVEEPQSEALTLVFRHFLGLKNANAPGFLHETPMLRKTLLHALKLWACWDPDSVAQCLQESLSTVPRVLQQAVKKGERVFERRLEQAGLG